MIDCTSLGILFLLLCLLTTLTLTPEFFLAFALPVLSPISLAAGRVSEGQVGA